MNSIGTRVFADRRQITGWSDSDGDRRPHL